MTGEIVHACTTLDCASKLRVHYILPRPLSHAFLSLFAESEVSIQAFSRHVPGARDHFTVVQRGAMRAAGALGDNKLVVTYGKAGGIEHEACREALEGKLSAAGYGRVCYLEPRAASEDEPSKD
jgi:hypothetical protein